MLLPLQGAIYSVIYPGRCPGLVSRWPFRPSLHQNPFLQLKKFIRTGRKFLCLFFHGLPLLSIHSDYTNIGFRRVDMGMYSYRIYSRPMNAEEKKEYDEDPMFIPYTDRVVFEYGGGAIGPQTFGEEIKEEFMKKHPVK